MLLRMGVLPAAIPSPSANAVDLGPFTFHVYGLCYALAVIAAVAITRRRWEAEGGSRELVYDVALWAFPAGIVGGRLYFLATTPGDAFEHWWGPLAIWEGGLGIWGGIALGTVVGLWRVKARRRRPRPLHGRRRAGAAGGAGDRADRQLLQPGALRAPDHLPWALEIDPEHRPDRYATEPTFHPTFLYELLWNLGLAAALVWLGHHRRIRPPGLFALYVAGYCAFRIVEELLRVDPAAHVLGVRWNLLLSIAGTLIGLAWFARIQTGPRIRRHAGAR